MRGAGHTAPTVSKLTEMNVGAQLGFFLLQIPSPGMVISTFRVGLLSSVKPVCKHPHRYRVSSS